MLSKNNLTAVLKFFQHGNFLMECSPTMDGRIFELQKRLVENLEHQWTIQQMAEIVELSEPHFQKLFKKEVGISPFAFLQNARLEKAREYLETTFWQMKQIGIAVGMPHDSHFTRDFKKKYGVTPTEYRKQFWEKIQTEKQIGALHKNQENSLF